MSSLAFHGMPFFRLMLPFLAGLLAALYCPLPVGVLGLFTVLLTLLFFFLFSVKIHYTFRWIKGLVAHLILFFAGSWMMTSRLHLLSSHIPVSFGDTCLVAEILEPPSVRDHAVSALMEPYCGPPHGRIMVSFPRDFRSGALQPGDVLLLKARFSPFSSPSMPGEFDYRKYCFYKGIVARAKVKASGWQKTSFRSRHPFRSAMLRGREKIKQQLSLHGLSRPTAAVLAGILFGETEDIDPVLLSQFSRAGVVHILSVSGLHVGMVYLLLGFCAGWFLRKRKKQVAVSLVILSGIWVYVALAGFSSPAVRAALMFSVVETGRCFDRSIPPLNLLAVSVFLLLLYNPCWIMDTGFQLSCMAVLGIMVWYQSLYALWQPSSVMMNKIWALVCVSVAAQVATLPLSMQYFHCFPLLFIPANLLVVPLATLILYAALALIPFSFTPLGSILKVLEFPVNAIGYLIAQIDHYAVASFSAIKFTTGMTLLTYLSLLLFTLALLKKDRFLFFSFVITVLGLFMYVSLDRIQQYRKAELMIGCLHGRQRIMILSHRGEAVVLSDSLITGKEKTYYLRNYFIQRYIVQSRFLFLPVSPDGEANWQFEWNGKKILWINKSYPFYQNVSCDVLIKWNRKGKKPGFSLQTLPFCRKIIEVSPDVEKGLQKKFSPGSFSMEFLRHPEKAFLVLSL